MANQLSKTGIQNSQTIQAWHVTQSIDALTAAEAYDITISGSLTLTGSVSSLNGFTGDLVGTASWASDAVSAVTASHAVTALSSSYALSGSYSTVSVSSSYALTALSGSYAISSSYSVSASHAESADLATTASHAVTALSASYASSASRAVESGITTLVRPSNTVSNFGYTVPYLSGTGSLATMYYSAIGPTYNPSTETITSANFEGTASYASTASIVQNYVDGTRNFTTISPQGTIYTKFEDVYASSSAVDEYDLLAAVTTFTGDRTIPTQYVTAVTTGEAKVVRFHINGKIVTGGGSPNPTIDCYVKIGTQELNATKVGAVDLVANSTGPFEIDGELVFTDNNIRSCVGLGFCNDNDQTFRKYPLSDLYAVGDNVPAGGALQFIVSGSSEDLEMTGSYAYIEFMN